MNDETNTVGRVLQASTTTFTVGCSRLISDQGQAVPQFGALVKALNPDDSMNNRGSAVYGLIYNVSIEDDAFVRQLVAAEIDDEVYIADQRQRRLVPIVMDVLVVGHGQGAEINHRLPPQPPNTLNRIYTCSPAEIVRFTERHDWLRIVLGSGDAPVDQLLVAALRAATDARRDAGQDGTYRIAAGRELARLLALDPARLDGVLQQLRDR
jgi:hypothetical protein